MYGIDYTEIFSLVAHLPFVCVLLSPAFNQAWSLHQLDVSNAFLYGDLEEQVFMEQPPEYVAQGESLMISITRMFFVAIVRRFHAIIFIFLYLV